MSKQVCYDAMRIARGGGVVARDMMPHEIRSPVRTVARPVDNGLDNSRRLNLTATTTGAAETVTVAMLNVTRPTLLNWGDGSVEMLPANSDTARTHVYATAGTYGISLPAANIQKIRLDNAKLGGLNTAELRYSPIVYFRLTLATNCTISSADMVNWRPDYWYLNSMPAGSYSISSADMVNWRPANWYLIAMPAVGSSYTFAVSCFRAWTGINQLRSYDIGIDTAAVDTILADIWAGRATYTAAAPSANVGGTNAAPTGNVIAPEEGDDWHQEGATWIPLTAGAMAYDLAKDVNGEGFKKWTITYTGGSIGP